MNDAALAAQATLLQRILDRSGLALVVIDGQRRVRLINGPLQSYLGLPIDYWNPALILAKSFVSATGAAISPSPTTPLQLMKYWTN